MKYKVVWQKKATKQILNLQVDIQKRIRDAVTGLQNSDTGWSNVKSLQNHRYSHRLRIGNFRVLFDADVTLGGQDEIRILDIWEVRKRDDRTY